MNGTTILANSFHLRRPEVVFVDVHPGALPSQVLSTEFDIGLSFHCNAVAHLKAFGPSCFIPVEEKVSGFKVTAGLGQGPERLIRTGKAKS